MSKQLTAKHCALNGFGYLWSSQSDRPPRGATVWLLGLGPRARSKAEAGWPAGPGLTNIVLACSHGILHSVSIGNGTQFVKTGAGYP